MNKFDVKCPFCGKVNRNLYLLDTDGLMECENCGKVSNHHTKITPIRVPDYKDVLNEAKAG